MLSYSYPKLRDALQMEEGFSNFPVTNYPSFSRGGEPASFLLCHGRMSIVPRGMRARAPDSPLTRFLVGSDECWGRVFSFGVFPFFRSVRALRLPRLRFSFPFPLEGNEDLINAFLFSLFCSGYQKLFFFPGAGHLSFMKD